MHIPIENAAKAIEEAVRKAREIGTFMASRSSIPAPT
jgi:hypothetical protein